MYKALAGLFVLLAALSCQAQLSLPIGGSSSGGDTNRKNARITSRILTGMVTDKGSDKPIPEAIVYLKNTKTLAVKSYISQNDGTYRFPELSPNVDYDVYAQKDGKKSSTKTLSQFDDRAKANINLQIEMNK
jgi:hypothetical protein